jgi:hypothetical protein
MNASRVAIECLESRRLLSLPPVQSTGNVQITSTAADTKGNLFAVGTFSGTTTFDQAGTIQLTATGNQDLFIMRVAAGDSSMMVRRLSSGSATLSPSKLVARSGHVVIAGQFTGQVDFDPGVGVTAVDSMGSFDGFVLDLNASKLAFNRVRTFGGTDLDAVSGVGIDSAGNIWAGGSFRKTVVFGTLAGKNGKASKMTSAGSSDAFLAKWSASGELLYVGRIGGIGSDAINTLCLDSSDNLVACGTFQKTVDSNPGSGKKYIVSSFDTLGTMIVGLSPSGAFRFSSAFTGDQYVSINGVSVDSRGDVDLAGSFLGTMDLDPGSGVKSATSAGGTDIWVAQLSSRGALRWSFQIGGGADDAPQDVYIGSKDELFVAGRLNGKVDLDPGVGKTLVKSGGKSDAYAARYSASGTFLGGARIGGTGDASGAAIVRNKTQYVLAVNFIDEVDLAPIRVVGGTSHKASLFNSNGHAQCALIGIAAGIFA